jgi:aspartate/methionine/tyrosine aminotransferase
MEKTIGAATRMDAIQAPIIAVIGDFIRQVPGTISLGQGVVHYGPPPEALAAVQAALSRPDTHQYTDGHGIPALLTRIAAKLAAENRIDVGRGSRIMVTAGGNMAFFHSVMATTAPGDEVILPTPFYFNHEMAIEMAGCRAVRVATDARYQLSIDALSRAITDRTRAIVTVSPSNPSGAVLIESSLREVNALCRERGIYHIADEPYEYFTYGSARHVSPGSFHDAEGHTISMYSLSKAFGFAGWRVGYMVYPAHLAPAMIKSQDTILICPSIASQAAAVAALDVGRAYCEPHVRELATIRDIVVSELATLGPLATVPTADGAFYVLMKVDTTMNPLAIAERLIREHKVAVIPGTAFGMTDGCYFRVAYGALQKDTVTEGIGRLVGGLQAILA